MADKITDKVMTFHQSLEDLVNYRQAAWLKEGYKLLLGDEIQIGESHVTRKSIELAIADRHGNDQMAEPDRSEVDKLAKLVTTFVENDMIDEGDTLSLAKEALETYDLLPRRGRRSDNN